MKYIIKLTGYYMLFLILISFICSLFNLCGVNSTITNLILFIFNIISFLVIGFKEGIKANKKGYMAGLKIGLILLILLYIINIIIARKAFSITMIIYYIILLLVSIFGAMIGISKKKED